MSWLQDISVAGKGAGLAGNRSGLWSEFARIIGEIRPSQVLIENSPMLVVRGLERVLCDLAALGFDAQWMCLSAAECGAQHKRDRFWLVANTDNAGQQPSTRGGGSIQGVETRDDSWRRGEGNASNPERVTLRNPTIENMEPEESIRAVSGVYGGDGEMADADNQRLQRSEREGSAGAEGQPTRHPPKCSWPDWPSEPELGRVANGVAGRVDRLKAIGNGQVPRVAAAAFVHLAARGGLTP